MVKDGFYLAKRFVFLYTMYIYVWAQLRRENSGCIYRVVQKKRNVFSNLDYSRLIHWIIKILCWSVEVVVFYQLSCYFRRFFVSQAETISMPWTGIFWLVRKQTSDVMHAKILLAQWEAWEVSKRKNLELMSMHSDHNTRIWRQILANSKWNHSNAPNCRTIS